MRVTASECQDDASLPLAYAYTPVAVAAPVSAGPQVSAARAPVTPLACPTATGGGWPTRRAMAAALAAALAVAVGVGFLGGRLADHAPAPPMVAAVSVSPPWLQRVVDYRALYARETVTTLAERADWRPDAAHRLGVWPGRELAVPGLGGDAGPMRYAQRPEGGLDYLPVADTREAGVEALAGAARAQL